MAERYDAIVIGAGQAGPAQRGRRRSREDDDVAAEIRAIREREGVAIRTGAQCMALSNVNGKISVQLECKGGEPVAQGSHVLLAVGRLPNTHDLGLNGDEIVHSLLDA